MRNLFPVFVKADWNRFSGGESWVVVPLKAYSHPAAKFDYEVGDTCIVVEDEEMLGCFATITELHSKTDKHGTPKFVKVRLDE